MVGNPPISNAPQNANWEATGVKSDIAVAQADALAMARALLQRKRDSL